MGPAGVDRSGLERAVVAARRRAAELVPFSPSWDALMGEIEDLERALWYLEPGRSPDEEPSLPVAAAREAIGA